MRVVRRELWVQLVARRQREPRRGEIGHVGVCLAREHGVALEAEFLRVLDLGVPVSALDQAYRDAAVGLLGQLGQETYDVDGASLVGLQREAETVVALEGQAAHYRGKNLQ